MGENKNRKMWRRIFSIYKDYKRESIVILTSNFIAGLSATLKPYLMKDVMDNVIYMNLSEALPHIGFIVLCLAVLLGIEVTDLRISTVLSAKVYDVARNKVRLRLFELAHKLGFDYYDTHNTGELYTAIVEDSEALSPG